MEDSIKKRDSERIAFMNVIKDSPIDANIFLYRDAFDEKINQHSKKIIRFLYGNKKSNSVISTFQSQDNVCIDFFDDNIDQQESFSFIEYIHFDFKDKKKYAAQRRANAKKIKKHYKQKHMTLRLNEMRKIINEKPEEAFKLLKNLTALK